MKGVKSPTLRWNHQEVIGGEVGHQQLPIAIIHASSGCIHLFFSDGIAVCIQLVSVVNYLNVEQAANEDHPREGKEKIDEYSAVQNVDSLSLPKRR